MESMESQEAGFPPFPHSLEIPSGLPHSHGLGCWHISKYKSMRDRSQGLLDLKGVVTEVLGPKCNERSSTLMGKLGKFERKSEGINDDPQAKQPHLSDELK
jgi:hypothetical protein